MSYAKALQKKTKTCVASEQTRVYAYAHSVHALWGDIDEYHPAVDGDYKTFFDASAAARKRNIEKSENTRTPQVEDDQERIREKALAREQRQKQAKAMALLREWSRLKVRAIRATVAIRAKSFNRKACKCGCGRLVHSNLETSGFCCNWCGKHGGRRGHGQACEAISSTTFLQLA